MRDANAALIGDNWRNMVYCLESFGCNRRSSLRFSLSISIVSLAALSACAPVDSSSSKAAISQRDASLLAERLADKVAGEPEKCVSTSRLGQPAVYGSQTVIYSGSGQTEYRNDLPSDCPGLDDDDIILTRTFGSQLCSGDTIQPVDRFSGFSGPICRLGEFIPYTKPKKPG